MSESGEFAEGTSPSNERRALLDESAFVLRNNLEMVRGQLELEGDGHEPTSTNLDLVHHPDSDRRDDQSVVGRFDGPTRVMLHRLYGAVGASMQDSNLAYHNKKEGTESETDEILLIPVGKTSCFQEITEGQIVGGEFAPITSRVTFTRNVRKENLS